MHEMLSKSSCPSLNELETELKNAGKKLIRWSSSSAVIYNVLPKLMENLSKVEQKPSTSMKNALVPVIWALGDNKLLRHPDVDVNILVSCCFCEILRINAPDSPYSYEQLKDSFETVVMTFEKLSSASGGCYTRMGRVLRIFSRNNLFVLMLNMQSDGARLIVRLFKQFLTVADSNTSAIVLEMEKIMIMTIEESVELKPELVRLIVDFLKNKKQTQNCRQLGEKVLINFAARFKPQFSDMGRDMSNALYDYSILAASIGKTKIKTECMDTEMRCQHEEQANLLYDLSNSVAEVNGKHKGNNNPMEKQVSSSEGGTVCVQGYEVKQSVAQILEDVFEKHGDIAANCIFKTTSMTSAILEVVCEVVRRIRTNEVVEKMEETEWQVSDAEAVNIDVAWLRAHLEAIRKKTVCLQRSNMLKETAKQTLLYERLARTVFKEMDAEVVAALERVERAEMLVNVFAAITKNLNEKLLECEAILES
ncbi:hypothetical protein M8C21_010882 [Ambrosia artemisiifolia]|uniref:Phospholipase-like protein n=1 Tax=Ambrosia artemisiifolia TaxID=4212 RepID=A0AAD5GD26_AMBAR|nr:hypothetical protein M8C21_010882 [Ambrosia artemisiifolia]